MPSPIWGSKQGVSGERIVAFGRPGKSGKSAVSRLIRRAVMAETPGFPARLQRFLKPRGVKNRSSGVFKMAGATKKREARKSLHQPGWITLDGGFAARPCVVQDMSGTGAKITIDDTNTLPGRLKLAFSRDARTGRNCEVVWRRGKSAGVKFVR
jgi:hypothetical protein